MTITIGANTPAGTYPLTVTGNGGGIKHSAMCTLVVAAKANFAISASPSSLTVAQGNQGTSTITTTISGGFSNSIALSASGMPSGTTVGFNPNPIPAPGAGNSTMTITVGASTPTGTYPITVTGNGGGIQQNITVTLTVTPQQQPNFTISGLAFFAHGCAGQPGNLDDHNDNQRRVQQLDHFVGFRDAIGNDRRLQSEPNSRTGCRQLDHDHHGRRQHSDRHLSHHGDGQRWWHSAEHHGHADGDTATATELFDFCLAFFARHRARQSRELNHHHHNQRRLQQLDRFIGFRDAIGNDRGLQSEPNSCARCRQLDHDHHGRR